MEVRCKDNKNTIPTNTQWSQKYVDTWGFGTGAQLEIQFITKVFNGVHWSLLVPVKENRKYKS